MFLFFLCLLYTILLIGVIFFLNKHHEFINSASALFWAASDNSVLLPAHDPSICLPSLSRCNNVGILHTSHSSSQSSLWDKSRNNFCKASSPNVSTTIFTILITFLVSSLRICHLGLS